LVEDERQSILVADYFAFELQTGANMWTSAVSARRLMFEKAGMFPLGVRGGEGEDLDMWMRLALTTRKMAYIPQALSNYNMQVPAGASDAYAKGVKSGKCKPHYPRTFMIIEQYSEAGRIPERLKVSARRWMEFKLPVFMRDYGIDRGFGPAWTMLKRNVCFCRNPGLWMKCAGKFAIGWLASFEGVRALVRKLKGTAFRSISVHRSKQPHPHIAHCDRWRH
jgi:hypothetical protein